MRGYCGCSSLTRQVYEEEAAEFFGLTLNEYYDLKETT